jgi:hypothetical protein
MDDVQSPAPKGTARQGWTPHIPYEGLDSRQAIAVNELLGKIALRSGFPPRRAGRNRHYEGDISALLLTLARGELHILTYEQYEEYLQLRRWFNEQ